MGAWYYQPKVRIQRVDISDAPDWAIELASRRTRLKNQEKADAVRRLQSEQNWTREKVAKLFGVTPESVGRWLKFSDEEVASRRQSKPQSKPERDTYQRARYQRQRRERVDHGRNGVRAAMWKEQDGKCYLCERPLGPGLMAVIEHDHRCCPMGKSCDDCRRGLACNRCNSLIAYAEDDADLLALIAANLRPAVEKVTARLERRDAGSVLAASDTVRRI